MYKMKYNDCSIFYLVVVIIIAVVVVVCVCSVCRTLIVIGALMTVLHTIYVLSCTYILVDIRKQLDDVSASDHDYPHKL